jgi:hypothetical protein
MAKATSNDSARSLICAICLLASACVACKLSSLAPAKMDMFAGTTAQDGADKIKAKLGVGDLKVHDMEIHEDRMSVVVQDPAKPKNFDEYVFNARGAVEGPKPVEALVVGNQEFSADKSRLFDLSGVDLKLVPEVCRKTAERAQIEDGRCELIQVGWESAHWTRSKEENDRIRAEKEAERDKQLRSGKYDAWKDFSGSSDDLVVTWRVWIKGSHATKDYWADAKGNVFDYQ